MVKIQHPTISKKNTKRFSFQTSAFSSNLLTRLIVSLLICSSLQTAQTLNRNDEVFIFKGTKYTYSVPNDMITEVDSQFNPLSEPLLADDFINENGLPQVFSDKKNTIKIRKFKIERIGFKNFLKSSNPSNKASVKLTNFQRMQLMQENGFKRPLKIGDSLCFLGKKRVKIHCKIPTGEILKLNQDEFVEIYGTKYYIEEFPKCFKFKREYFLNEDRVFYYCWRGFFWPISNHNLKNMEIQKFKKFKKNFPKWKTSIHRKVNKMMKHCKFDKEGSYFYKMDFWKCDLNNLREDLLYKPSYLQNGKQGKAAKKPEKVFFGLELQSHSEMRYVTFKEWEGIFKNNPHFRDPMAIPLGDLMYDEFDPFSPEAPKYEAYEYKHGKGSARKLRSKRFDKHFTFKNFRMRGKLCNYDYDKDAIKLGGTLYKIKKFVDKFAVRKVRDLNF